MNEQILNVVKNISNNKKVQNLLLKILDKILLKQNNIENYIKINENEIIHICDWITSVVENNEEWKIPRVSTLDALNNAANKYFQKRNNKLQTIELDETQEKLITNLNDYYIVQMLTPEALDNESKVMQHCIGHGGYDKKIKNPDYQYLSLRDRFNKAHCTLEIKNNEILQLQGKQNKLPEEKYLDNLLPWLIENNYKINLNRYGFIFNKNDKKIYSIYNLPDNCEIDGDFRLNIEIKKIPKNLKINGSIIFDNIEFKSDIFNNEFFKNDNKIEIYNLLSFLIINNYDIYLTRFHLTFNKNDNKIYSIYNMPDNCETNNDINLYHSKIEKLPDNLIVNGDLNLSFCPNLEILPNNLIVKGNLELQSTKITKLPDNIKIGGYLNLSFSKIEKLPDNLTVNKDIYLMNCKNIKEIPNGLIVNGNLDLSGCINFEKLPDNLIANGDIFCSFTNIKKLPDNLTVNGTLDLSYSNIKKIPNDIKINGDLYLNYCYDIQEIPENLDVGGSLFLSHTYIKEIKKIKVGKKLEIFDTEIEKISSELECNEIFIDNYLSNYGVLLNETMKIQKIFYYDTQYTKEEFFQKYKKEIITNYLLKIANNEQTKEILLKYLYNIILQQKNYALFIINNNNIILNIRNWITSIIENNEKWRKPKKNTILAYNDAANLYFNK